MCGSRLRLVTLPEQICFDSTVYLLNLFGDHNISHEEFRAAIRLRGSTPDLRFLAHIAKKLAQTCVAYVKVKKTA